MSSCGDRSCAMQEILSACWNKAVQEAYSGKQYIRADIACLIATAGFTKSAKELAQSALFYLVEAEDIDIFSEHITKEIEA